MTIVSLVIQVIAVICLFCAAIGVNAPKVNLGWLGLALWLLSLMVSGITLHEAH